jgi:hypothetical protein
VEVLGAQHIVLVLLQQTHLAARSSAATRSRASGHALPSAGGDARGVARRQPRQGRRVEGTLTAALAPCAPSAWRHSSRMPTWRSVNARGRTRRARCGEGAGGAAAATSHRDGALAGAELWVCQLSYDQSKQQDCPGVSVRTAKEAALGRRLLVYLISEAVNWLRQPKLRNAGPEKLLPNMRTARVLHWI